MELIESKKELVLFRISTRKAFQKWQYLGYSKNHMPCCLFSLEFRAPLSQNTKRTKNWLCKIYEFVQTKSKALIYFDFLPRFVFPSFRCIVMYLHDLFPFIRLIWLTNQLGFFNFLVNYNFTFLSNSLSLATVLLFLASASRLRRHIKHLLFVQLLFSIFLTN